MDLLKLYIDVMFPFSSDDKQVEFGINAYLEEYKAIRAEIVSMLSSSYQVMNITIAATAVQVSALPTILQWQKPYLLGITPFIFYALVWIQLRYSYAVYNMSNHIIFVIAPAIRRLLVSNDVNNYDDLMTWESRGRLPNHPKSIWMYPLEFARYFVPLLTAVAVFISYISIVISSNNFDTYYDSGMIVVNAALFVYTVFALINIRSLLKNEDLKPIS
jgi:hypothetical protein